MNERVSFCLISLVVAILFTHEALAIRPAVPPQGYQKEIVHTHQFKHKAHIVQTRVRLVDNSDKDRMGEPKYFPLAEGLYSRTIAYRVCQALGRKYKYDAKKAIAEQPFLIGRSPTLKMSLTCTDRRKISGEYVDVKIQRNGVKVPFKYSDCEIKRVDKRWGNVPIINPGKLAKRLVAGCGQGGASYLNRGVQGVGITRVEVLELGDASDDIPNDKRHRLELAVPRGESQPVSFDSQTHF